MNYDHNLDTDVLALTFSKNTSFSNALTLAPIFKGICILNYLSITELK